MSVNRVCHTKWTGVAGTSSAIDTTAATMLVVVIACVNTIPTITDSQSNSWTALDTIQTGARFLQPYYKIAPTTSASHTFTIADGAAMDAVVVGWDPTSPVASTHNTGAGSFTTTIQPGSLTPGGATNLIMSALGGDANTSIAIDSSYAIGESATNTPYGPQGVALAWLEQASATAQNPTWTVGANGSTLNASAFSFTFTGGGGGATATIASTSMPVLGVQ